MLSPTTATIRLTLHVLAATIWVGGQFTLAGLLPVLRAHEGLAKQAARAFNRIAWPAFGVLVLTGMWNLADVNVADAPTSYQVTVFVKILVAIVAGAGRRGARRGPHQARPGARRRDRRPRIRRGGVLRHPPATRVPDRLNRTPRRSCVGM